MGRVLEADLPARWSRRQRWKNTAIYVSLRVAWAVMRLLPFPVARAVGAAIGRMAAWIDGPDRRRAMDNLRHALPQLSESERRRIARQMFVHLAVSAVELVHIERFIRGPERIELGAENRAVFDAALRRGKGVIAVAGHLGNWELLAQVIAAAGYPITSIAKKIYDPRLTRWVHKHRTAWGHKILWRGDDGVPKQLLRVFRDNAILGLLIDQDTRVQGAFVPFFGRLAHTPTAAASMALRNDAALIVGRTWREGQKHRLAFELIEPPAGDDHETRVLSLTAILSTRIEEAIRKTPEQWVWLHDRWKRQPPLD